ncbi:MAG: hypothetical protein IKP47_09600 [Ruminococcus sp.]|nr:hypothetical protein [Ruminococcus sp.]
MELKSRVAYLKGLMDGLNISEETNEGKVLRVMSEVLDEIAGAVEDLAVEVDEAVELIDSIDQDLGEVEEDLYGLDEDEDRGDEDFDEEQYECVCPTCGETICLNESLIELGSIDCPNCGEKLEFDFGDDEEEGE